LNGVQAVLLVFAAGRIGALSLRFTDNPVCRVPLATCRVPRGLRRGRGPRSPFSLWRCEPALILAAIYQLLNKKRFPKGV
jgi:hypothetical protein